MTAAYRCDLCADPALVLLLDVSTGGRLCRSCAERLHAMSDHYREEHPHGATIGTTVLGT